MKKSLLDNHFCTEGDKIEKRGDILRREANTTMRSRGAKFFNLIGTMNVDIASAGVGIGRVQTLKAKDA